MAEKRLGVLGRFRREVRDLRRAIADTPKPTISFEGRYKNYLRFIGAATVNTAAGFIATAATQNVGTPWAGIIMPVIVGSILTVGSVTVVNFEKYVKLKSTIKHYAQLRRIHQLH